MAQILSLSFCPEYTKSWGFIGALMHPLVIGAFILSIAFIGYIHWSQLNEKKAEFKKRERGLIRQVKQLSALRGVDACAIIYSPYSNEPTVWPSHDGAKAVLARFNRLSEFDRTRNMVTLDSYIRLKKTEEQLQSIRKETKHRDLETFMHKCIAGQANIGDFDIRDTEEMRWVINETLKNINAKKEAIRMKAAQNNQTGFSPASAPPPPTGDSTGN